MIRVTSLKKSFTSADGRAVAALREVSFATEPGEFYTLLGPSGCGKTTTLRSIAGFETPEGGEIRLGDKVVFSSAQSINMPPFRRDFGIVFQSYAIWPHMTVFDNVAFPLLHGRKRYPKAEVRERVARALALVQLGQLADRPAPFLSGGQQQRVALARSLVHEPKVLLLDEPLSNLDANLREDMRFEIRALVKRLGITTLYVTHDQLEALTMSDRIAVISAGEIMQEGTPLEIYKSPQTQMVAHFIGLANFLEGKVAATDGNGSGSVTIGEGTLHCTLPKTASVGNGVVVMVRPEDVAVCDAERRPEQNVLEGETESVAFTGEMLDCWINSGGHRLRAKVHPATKIAAGARVWLHLEPARCRAMAAR